MIDQQAARSPGRLVTAASLLIFAGLVASCGGGSGDSSDQSPPANNDERTETGGTDDVTQVPEPAPETPADPAPSPAPAPTPAPAPEPDPAPPPAPPPATATAEATYEFVFTAQWTTENGFGSVPGPAHFSGIIGAAVNEQSRLWTRGQAASVGIEEVAEEGTTPGITAQIRLEIAANAAREITFVGGPRNSGSVSGTVTFSDAHPALSFVTMVAPSPDWFVGLSRQSMKDASGQWIASFDRQLPIYDAGTEEGDSFSTSGATTNPQGVITRLNGLIAGSLPFVDGTVNGNAIARVQLRRIR